MKNFITIFILITVLLSCANEIEEIKNPNTGKLLKRFEFYTDDSGQKIKNGFYTEWDESGNKIKELQYKDDSLNGLCKFFTPNSETMEIQYDFGKKNGFRKVYNQKGQTVVHENYSNGKLNGIQKYFFDDGMKESFLNYNNGVPEGKWTFFDTKEKILCVLDFKNGICQNLIGNWKFDDRLAYLSVNKKGFFQYSYPYFKSSDKVVLQSQGIIFHQGRKFQLLNENGTTYHEFEFVFVKNNEITIVDHNQDDSPLHISILQKMK